VIIIVSSRIIKVIKTDAFVKIPTPNIDKIFCKKEILKKMWGGTLVGCSLFNYILMGLSKKD